MGGDATSVGDSVEPCGQAAGDPNQRTMFIHSSTIDRALRSEVVGRGGHQDFLAHEPDRGTIRGMKARLLDLPSCPTVAAGAEPGRSGGHHDARTARVRANLVDVAIDVDSGTPGCTTVHRSRDTADMHISEEHRAVRSRSYGTDPERR